MQRPFIAIMSKAKKQEDRSQINLLDVVPVKLVDSETDGNGLTVLLKPKFKNNYIKKYLVPRMKHPNYKINLDEFGSYVWYLCDGTRNVFKIAESLREKFGDKIEPVHERLGFFIRQLEQNKLIRYKID
ncbi:PqqD family protein [candidate division KSB1 bacterium]|nr:PqqD family protein [candidate division KSB1 bacterium]